MIERAKSLWRSAVEWFEHGDLIPLMVLVSAAHYARVLAGKDDILSAVAIGLLVDLGHYRTVRYAVRYTGDKRAEIAFRWAIAIIMTAVSLAYHFRYYNDLLLAAPLPFLIAVLAWLESRNAKRNAKPSDASDTQPVADGPVQHPRGQVDSVQAERVRAWYAEHPGASARECARELSISPTTASKYRPTKDNL